MVDHGGWILTSGFVQGLKLTKHLQNFLLIISILIHLFPMQRVHWERTSERVWALEFFVQFVKILWINKYV